MAEPAAASANAMAAAPGSPAEPDVMDDVEAAEVQRANEAFQRQYENDHTWDTLQEDEHGMLQVDRTREQRQRRERALAAAAAQTGRVRKGMIRYLLLVVDLSSAASGVDLRPNRLTCMLRAAQDFVRSFFDQNPLSQLGLLAMRGGVCVRLTELSASPETQIRRLEAAALTAEGAASLANALDMSVTLLRNIPKYGHREVLVLFASLSTCDPGDVYQSIKAAKEAHIRVSVVGVSAEVYVCRRMCDETGGTYGVALHEAHLNELLAAHAPPPALLAGAARAELVSMGFPQKGPDGPSSAVFVGVDALELPGSYACPRCKARVAELPSECHVCGLTLISSPHLARSYHHLFPVPTYHDVNPTQLARIYHQHHHQEDSSSMVSAHPSSRGGGKPPLPDLQRGTELGPGCLLYCYGCLRDLSASVEAAAGAVAGGPVRRRGVPLVLQCPSCAQAFCFECDVYVHEGLHNCPGCAALRAAAHVFQAAQG